MCHDSQLTDTYLALGRSTEKRNTKILHDIPKIILQDRAPNTVKKYADAFQRWNSWAKSKGLQALPTTGHQLALYLAFLIKSAKSMATIYTAVYGTAWAHQKMSMASPTEHPIVKQMM